MADAKYIVEVDWDNDGDFRDANEDITADVKGPISFNRGKNRELGFADPGTLSLRLTDPTNKYSPENAGGVLYGNLLPKRAVRVRHVVEDSVSAWLGNWAHRIKITLDKDDIDAALANFPVLVYLSASSGIGGVDVSCVFDELTLDANRKKIAVTTSDGITQCYVEIEKWDDANEKAYLWVKVPAIASGADTELYLYYDILQADNDTYVGDTNSAPAEAVWDADFLLVCHMRDDPDTTHVRDSTGNNHDGTKGAATEPTEIASKISEGQDFDGNEYVTITDTPALSALTALTAECIIKTSTDKNLQAFISKYFHATAREWVFQQRGVANEIILSMFDQSANAFIQGYITAAVYDGAYHQIASSWNGGVNPATSMVLYKDGAPGVLSTGSVGVFVNIDDTAQDVLIGRQGNLARDVVAELDEVRLSKSVRAPEWVKATYETCWDDLAAYGSEENLHSLFYGYLEDIRPHPHLAEQSAFLYAIDGLDFLARHELGTVLYKNQLTGTLVGHILDSAGWAAGLRTIDAGQDTVPYAYWKDVMARFALQELEESEMGFINVDGTGKLVWEDRHHRYSATHQTSQATFTDTMAQIVYDLGVASVRNEIRATVTPWTLQGLAELWRLQEVPSISAGETKTWWGDSDSFVDAWTTPVITTDYLANTQADGLGVDKSAALGIVTTKFAKAIKLEVTNNDANTVFITLLKARGTAYDDETKVSRKTSDATSQGLYQKRTLELDGKFLTDAEKAQDFCDYGVARFKNPQPEIKMVIINKTAALLTQILTRQLSDRITVQNTRLGLDKDFFINRMEHEISESGKLHICTFYLVDASNEDFWCLDYSELDIGTKLGY